MRWAEIDEIGAVFVSLSIHPSASYKAYADETKERKIYFCYSLREWIRPLNILLLLRH